jgi:tetratricopeptide (TPR) repeat protein
MAATLIIGSCVLFWCVYRSRADFILCRDKFLKGGDPESEHMPKSLLSNELLASAREGAMRGQTRTAGVVVAMLWVVTPLTAIYVQMETRQVPVSRLVANLERDLKADPGNIQLLINLARLHAMAFAVKQQELPASPLKKDEPDRPWYGYESTHVPSRVSPATTAEQTADAEAHLKKALEYYQAALAIDQTNSTAGLGYAWVLEQSSRKPEAIAEYRRVIQQAWTAEQKVSRAQLGQRFFTEEAAGYLIPLLDPERDKIEIDDLQSRRNKLRAMPRPITPIAIPLADAADPLAIADPLARVRFDADGSGLRREWTWITPDAGWLVYDAQDRRTITSALQWFGNVTFWLFWSNGYEALRSLDDNGDGELTGAELMHLAIWHDRNRNGMSEPGEVASLATHGMVALSCKYVEGDGSRVAAFSPRGVTLSDGRSRPTVDVILRQPSSTLTRR